MTKIRIVSGQNVTRLLDMKSAMDAVQDAYVLKVENKAQLFPIVTHDFAPQKTGDMDIKSGWIEGEGVLGLKLVTYFEDNHKIGLPLLYGTIVLCESSTGRPLGIVDGSSITAIRTGAAGGVGAKWLANPHSETVLMLGAGFVAKYMLAATLLAMDNIQTVYIHDPLGFENAQRFAESISTFLLHDSFSFYSGDSRVMKKLERVKFIPAKDLAVVTPLCDIVLTATPSHTPLIQKQWVKPGTHFSCIGADMVGKQEIDAALFSGARVFVDDLTQAIEVGESEIPVKQGFIRPEEITEMGCVINGKAPGRQTKQDITIFDSTGIALQDLLSAKAILHMAEQQNMGVVAEL